MANIFDDVVRGTEKVAKNTTKKTASTTATHYAKPNQGDIDKATSWLQNGNPENLGVLGRANQAANLGWANLQQAASKEGRTVLGMAGRHAVQGAAWGAVAGGTVEAAQGGSFWDGAKQGAFNGAAISVGARGLKRATGADSYMFGAKNGKQTIAASANNMWRATNADPQISGQARAILQNRQMEGVSRAFMNQRKREG